jgi:hypothetical protein
MSTGRHDDDAQQVTGGPTLGERAALRGPVRLWN